MSERPEAVGEHRRYPRYADRRKVYGLGSSQFVGETRNVSGGGAAIFVPEPTSPFGNDEFVDLHIEGLGNRRARIVRELSDAGYALEFEDDEAEKARIAADLAKFHANVGRGYA